VVEHRQISFCAITELTPHPRNPRKHNRAQIRAIAKSIKTFGFTAPVLVDRNGRILAGHGRWEAAKFLGLTHVPVVFLDHLTEAQANAYMLADNKLTDRSSWDDVMVATQLKELSELVLDFDIEATGFEAPEIDFRIQSLDETDTADRADEFDLASGPAVSVPGDLWTLGAHRLRCGSALENGAYSDLFENERAAAVFTDPPYSHAKERPTSFVNNVTAAIGKFQESTHHDPALAEALTQISEALKEIERRLEALEASAME